MYNVLVLGCGNIGAQYDFNNDEVQTHVKAWSLNKLVSISIFDINKELTSTVAKRYKCKIVNEISVDVLSKFDIVSICTPTSTHYNYLSKSLLAGVKTIICEKPIAYNLEELKKIQVEYLKSDSKIIVNYIRRFQPEFIILKESINSILQTDSLTNMSIRYQRGFINNCSHAIDLIEFLFNSKFDLNDIKLHNYSFDQFNDDPTLSIMAYWKEINVNIFGLSDVLFSQFEIDIFFKNQKIIIKEAGNVIEFYETGKSDKSLQALTLKKDKTKMGCLKNYMIPVINYTLNCAENSILRDNFLSSFQLNLRLLNYLKH